MSDNKTMPCADLVAAIPTYRRTELLRLLLQDLAAQTCSPNNVIVVDGDPGSGKVVEMLRNEHGNARQKYIYVPSNHANLAYQRFLAWSVAVRKCRGIILYLDDDMRISKPSAVDLLLAPIRGSENNIVGVTGSIIFGDAKGVPDENHLLKDRYLGNSRGTGGLAKCFGSGRNLAPGSLTPSGHRVPPTNSRQACTVQWLRGGVMAISLAALTRECFSEDLFALSEIGCGHGEDTFLARRLCNFGNLALVPDAEFLHPNADTPKAYAINARRMGWGIAWSRRLLNDNYRWPKRPTILDRVSLIRSYAGNILLNAVSALRSRKLQRLNYLLGYSCGAARGVWQSPANSLLSPAIDWDGDCRAAISRIEEIG